MKKEIELPLTALGTGILHRMQVDLPAYFCETGNLLQSRFVFFEAPSSVKASEHLVRLLSAAWNIDAAEWEERGYIYNGYSAHELLKDSYGGPETGDLRCLECGFGGELHAVGPDRVHYVRRTDVDIFTSPPVARRLNILLDQIERMYAALQAKKGSSIKAVK